MWNLNLKKNDMNIKWGLYVAGEPERGMRMKREGDGGEYACVKIE
jgi:hypothetical protein